MKHDAIVNKMLEYCRKIQNYSTGLDYHLFVSTSIVTEACVFNLLQLGELVSKIDGAFMEEHQHIPWKSMRGLRHRLVHDYEGANMELVWSIIKNDIPDLVEKLRGLNISSADEAR